MPLFVRWCAMTYQLCDDTFPVIGNNMHHLSDIFFLCLCNIWHLSGWVQAQEPLGSGSEQPEPSRHKQGVKMFQWFHANRCWEVVLNRGLWICSCLTISYNMEVCSYYYYYLWLEPNCKHIRQTRLNLCCHWLLLRRWNPRHCCVKSFVKTNLTLLHCSCD